MDILFFSLLTNLLYYCCGKLFVEKKYSSSNNQFYIYFLGFVSISFIALLVNFITKLSPSVNTTIYIIILVIFFAKFKLKFNKDDLTFLLLSSFITFSLVIYSNVNRPDAGLYHLPFISMLNEHKLIIGINNIHFRFGHTSILQYISAINNNYIFKEEGITLPLASIVSFFYIYFLKDVWRVIKKKDLPNIGNIFSLFILIYISYKITRYSSFGNDAVSHLTLFYLISYILKNNFNNLDFNKTFLISVFIFINKPTLGLIFIIPGIIFFTKYNLISKKLLKLLYSYPLILLFLWLIKNLLISGCFIFPAKITCVESLPWTDNEIIIKAYKESEAWSKGWPDRKNKKIKMSDFNKNFNWFDAWSSKHLKYILKTIIPYIIVLMIITFLIKKYLYSHEKKDLDLRNRIYLSIVTSFLGFISFLLVFPIYRYGYSFIVSFIALIFIFFLKEKIYSEKIKLFKFIFIFSIFFFSIKQFQKIYNNYNFNRWPNIYTFNENKIMNDYKSYKIGDDFLYYRPISGDSLCMYSKSPCTSYKLKKSIKHRIYLGYSVLLLN